MTGLDHLDSDDAAVSGTGELDHIASAASVTADILSLVIENDLYMQNTFKDANAVADDLKVLTHSNCSVRRI